MKAAKQQKLENQGWRLGDAADFLGLSKEEREFLDLKLQLGRKLRQTRVERSWTQVHFARMVHSSQSRVAKMESGDPSVSLDLLVRSLLTAGVSRRDLALAMGSSQPLETKE